METKRAESGRSHSRRESDMYREEVIGRRVRFDESKEMAYLDKPSQILSREKDLK